MERQRAGAVAVELKALLNLLAVEGLMMRERVGADNFLEGGAENILKTMMR